MFLEFSQIIYNSVEYFNSKDDRLKHADVINECVNIELEEKFKLRGFSVIEYCVCENEKPPIGKLKKIFLSLKFNENEF